MSHQRPLAIVTGGSSGIGFELARQLAAGGYDLAITASSERVHAAARELAGLGVEVYAHQADAGSFEGVESFWRFVEGLDRPVEVAALNVGVAHGGAFVDTPLAEELRIIAINVTGTVHLAKRVVQHMVPNGAGKILIVSSVSATTPTPYETVYGPTKAFGFMFAESLREELRDSGVTVTALLPGATDSDFHKNAGMANSPIGRRKKFDKTVVAREGIEALMNDVDHVVSGDEQTRLAAIENRTLPEPVKAARHAKAVKIDQVAV